MKRIIAAMILLLLLSSCATPSTMMVNPDNGQITNCATMGWGVMGSITALSGHDSCVKSMESVGWVTVDEYKEAKK